MNKVILMMFASAITTSSWWAAAVFWKPSEGGILFIAVLCTIGLGFWATSEIMEVLDRS